ncbi:hypothetical protein Poli38472_004033 [Pythium oligandrum]|uniref:Fibronectin type-III domain-containing protein n=1 Tax=Pythium oligandrum TaxID=41045 RepID=A0A8K1FQ53_PYTOL|nr:hypothetical protein Poli38472_004033 [Pythium oligandrum]|eukprot:TMW66268.1 hypothetical protein Poli38472_004033 [Pythium oligandrum]
MEAFRRSSALPALSPSRRDDRGVRADSVTNQLRTLAKQKPGKRRALVLEPIEQSKSNSSQDEYVRGATLARSSVQKQIQGPVTLQCLVDDFVQAAGEGNLGKVDHYIRGGIPIDLKHSVLEYTALHASAALHNDVVTKHLVQAGADVDALTKAHETTLHLAARYKSHAVAEEVLRNHAKMRSLNKDDMTAMEVAGDIQAHTMEQLLEPPPDPPSHLRTTAIASTSIALAWTSHCVATSAYQFRVSWALQGSISEFSEISSTTSFRIVNLMPASTYRITVQAGNLTAGWSANSEELMTETEGDAPNAMTAPTITQVSDCSISMRIRLPQANGADITRVGIQFQCTGGISDVTTATFRKLLRPSDEHHRWETVLCDIMFMRNCEGDHMDGYKEHTVSGLLPGHVYYFRVKAYNRFGWSPDGEISDGIGTNDTPKIVSRSARSMMLVWTKPYSTELIDKYQIQTRASYSTKWDVVAQDIREQRVEVVDLIPATAYSIRVVPHYALRGWEDTDKCVYTELISTDATVPEPPVNFSVVDRTANSITLTWEMPRCNGHAVLGYHVDYRSSESGEEEWTVANAAVSVVQRQYALENLLPGQTYAIRVRAFNTLGSGEFVYLSNPASTYAFLPPTAPICTARTSFSLDITWQDGDLPSTQGQITYTPPAFLYYVEMCQVESHGQYNEDFLQSLALSASWTTVSSSLRERCASISGLTPLGCYCFRIRASPVQNDTAASVRSPVSQVVQTLRRM